MALSQHSAAPEHLPWFVTAPGATDALYVVTTIVVIASVLLIGVLFFWLHSLPERLSHRKAQFDAVAVLGLISLFTHQHIFWIIGLFLALIDLPDFMTPLRRITKSAERIARVGATPVAEALNVPRVPLPAAHEDTVQAFPDQITPVAGNGTFRKHRRMVLGLAVVAAAIIGGMNVYRWMQPPPETSNAIPPVVVEQQLNQDSPESTPPASDHKSGPSETTEAGPPPVEAVPGPDGNKTRELPASPPVTTKPPPPTAPEIRIEREPGRKTEQPVTPAETKPAPPGIDSVQIEKSGNLVIAGRAASHSEITLRLKGRPIGKAMADADGKFVVTPDAPLPSGRDMLTIESRSADQPAAPAASTAVAVVIPEREGPRGLSGARHPDKLPGIPPQVDPESKKPAAGPAAPVVIPEREGPRGLSGARHPDKLPGIPPQVDPENKEPAASPAAPVVIPEREGPRALTGTGRPEKVPGIPPQVKLDEKESADSPDPGREPNADAPAETGNDVTPQVTKETPKKTGGKAKASGRRTLKSKVKPRRDEDLLESPGSTVSRNNSRYRPYWIEKRCKKNNTKCDFRLRYAPGQDLTATGSDTYWYGKKKRSIKSSKRDHRESSRHAEWCKKRYRTYNSRTDQFVGKDRKKHRCNSPFDRQP